MDTTETDNIFGGDWTEKKINILVDYAREYLKILDSQRRTRFRSWKLLYFDGFAGSGIIKKEKTDEVLGDYTRETIGAARRIIEINEPVDFDMYYFVELSRKNHKLLVANTRDAFPEKKNKIKISQEDCNNKLEAMAKWLKEPQNLNVWKTLAYVDPYGMQLKWSSIEALRGLSIDMWILVPTGMGVNRMITKTGKIKESWIKKLETFLGMSRKEIETYFYSTRETLFPDITITTKNDKAIEKAAVLYKNKLQSVFEYVSEPFELKNGSNSIMFHLFCVTNKKPAQKIANHIVNKYNKN